MSSLVRIAENFTNIRSSFRLGPVDIGTHASLIKRKNGKFLMLDSVQLEPSTKAQVDEITERGEKLEAIINTHPFHTVSCEWAHKAYPGAALYGSIRHVEKFPQLPWEKTLVESAEMKEIFADDIQLSIPRGVDFVSSNENVHFSSAVVFHPDSRTVHVDDTFTFVPLPEVAEYVGIKQGKIVLHPTLPLALQQRPGAVKEFREWMNELILQWQIKNICTAHVGNLTEEKNTGESINVRLQDALSMVEPVLYAHEKLYG